MLPVYSQIVLENGHRWSLQKQKRRILQHTNNYSSSSRWRLSLDKASAVWTSSFGGFSRQSSNNAYFTSIPRTVAFYSILGRLILDVFSKTLTLSNTLKTRSYKSISFWLFCFKFQKIGWGMVQNRFQVVSKVSFVNLMFLNSRTHYKWKLSIGFLLYHD